MRLLTKDDYIQSLELSQYAFQYILTKEEKNQRLDMFNDHQVWGIFEDNRLASKLHLFPHSVFIEKKEIKMGGIAGVATWPEYRRLGYVNKLMIHSLKEMKRCGQLISYLHPFKVSFYRKYGWELIADQKKYQIKKEDLTPLSQASGFIKRACIEQDTEQLNHIYELYAKQYNGMLKRSQKWWRSFAEDKSIHYVMYFNSMNEPLGYLMYSIKDKKMKVEEFIAIEIDGTKALWNFICQHDSMIEEVEIVVPANDLLAYMLQNPQIEQHVHPYFMGRIVDVENFLLQYPLKKIEQPLFIHLYDAHAEWNNGTYLIKNGQVKLYQKGNEASSCAHPPKRGIQLDIQTLTCVLMGYKRVDELVRIGRIQGEKEETELLKELMTQRDTAFLDFF
ncbi:GNAT family N-acetyltransferase [Metabacillus iocasae]|uniref:Acetyltransferase n=1 Tax=Priestia iocasae TaxID=2291674 RepID=A0ABS2QV36_9BACI|nr:GNAT family N-acetyltransferase [Metabacillus iocasae]MBM7703348.1 putative acetyltransferase [Metabacillus iocasae]